MKSIAKLLIEETDSENKNETATASTAGYGNAAPTSPIGAVTFPDVSRSAADVLDPNVKRGSGDVFTTFKKRKKKLEETVAMLEDFELSTLMESVINEIGSKPSEPYEFAHTGSKYKMHTFEFTSNSNTLYTVNIDSVDEIDVGRDSVYCVMFKPKGGEYNAITNKCEMLSILSTVNDILLYAKYKCKVKHITFTGSKTDTKRKANKQRENVYMHYFYTRHPEWDMKIVKDADDHDRYVVHI